MSDLSVVFMDAFLLILYRFERTQQSDRHNISDFTKVFNFRNNSIYKEDFRAFNYIAQGRPVSLFFSTT